MRAPDSRVARDAEEVIREIAPPFLANHSYRSYHFAVALAERDEIRFDSELLYVAALFHDVGLLAAYDTGRCFEDDGAAAAAAFTAARGWPDDRTATVAEAIRLHAALQIELGEGPEAFLLWHSTAFDVRGRRYSDVTAETVAAVFDAYPRLDFKEGFSRLLEDQAARKPHCVAATWVAEGIADQIAAAPFPS